MTQNERKLVHGMTHHSSSFQSSLASLIGKPKVECRQNALVSRSEGKTAELVFSNISTAPDKTECICVHALRIRIV